MVQSLKAMSTMLQEAAEAGVLAAQWKKKAAEAAHKASLNMQSCTVV